MTSATRPSKHPATLLALALTLALGGACDDDDTGTPDAGSDAGTPGDGDGDLDASPGDGDGDGDIDASPGDGDGDGDAGGDGDGDGDGDAGGDGDGDGDGDAGDGDGDAGDGDGDGDAGDGDAGTELKCNGYAALCDRKFNEVAFPATHNAMSAEDEGFLNPDQQHGLEKQLDDGIRAMELDVWSFQADGDASPQLYLCHGGACVKRRRLSDGLGVVKTFLENNPSDVLTILFEDHVSAVDLYAALETAGLTSYMYTQAKDATWPTLRELIASNKRLVTLYERQFDNAGNFPAIYHYTWEYAWDTSWEFDEISDFTEEAEIPDGGTDDADCALYRGTADGLFILNHMLDTGPNAKMFAETINTEAFMLARIQRCQEVAQAIPNFVKVDFYDVGDLFKVIRKVNGLDE